MGAVEIILIITGIVLIFLSCIFTGNSKKNQNDSSFSGELTEEDKKKIENFIQEKLEKSSEATIIATDDTLSNISNEKIMAINDFAEPLSVKIQENHDHVVFLYNMLNQKDDEIKQTLADMEKAKQQLKDTSQDVLKLTRQLNSAIKKSDTVKDGNEKEEKKVSKNENNEKDKNTATSTSAVEINETANSIDEAGIGRNEAILKEYKAGKTVMDISRELNIGQGEVKLVIDLYGREN